MKCFICNGDVLWGNDFDAEDAYDMMNIYL